MSNKLGILTPVCTITLRLTCLVGDERLRGILTIRRYSRKTFDNSFLSHVSILRLKLVSILSSTEVV